MNVNVELYIINDILSD